MWWLFAAAWLLIAVGGGFWLAHTIGVQRAAGRPGTHEWPSAHRGDAVAEGQGRAEALGA